MNLVDDGNLWYDLYSTSQFLEDDSYEDECYPRFIDISEGETIHRMVLDLTKHPVETNAGSFTRYNCATLRAKIDGIFAFSGRYAMRYYYAGDVLITKHFISKHLRIEDGFTMTDVEHFVMLAVLCKD